jgi:general secretion pathway protein D
MEEVAELLTMGSGVQVAVSKGASAETVTIYLEGISLENALKTICKARGLWYLEDPGTGVIHVMTVDEFRAGVSTYDEEMVEVVTIRYPRAEEIGETLQELFQNRVSWTPPRRRAEDRAEEIEDALDRMDLMAERATLALQGHGAGSSTYGYPSGRVRTRLDRDRQRYGRTTIYDPYRRAYRPEEREGPEEPIPADLLAQYLAQKEAGASAQTLNEILSRPGVVHISAFPESNQLLLRSSDKAATVRVKAVIELLDNPEPQVLLEVKVLDVLVDDEQARGIDWLFRAGSVSGGWSRGITEPVGQAIEPPAANLVPQGSGLDPRAAVFGLVTDSVRARLQLLQDENRVTELATPNLLVADNEASRVFVGSEETVELSVDVENIITTEGIATSTLIPTTTDRRIGTTLLITPRIHADRTVTIRILQEQSRLGEKEPTVNGGFTRAIEERSVTTTVIARDSNIIAIGGLIGESVGERIRGIPGLKRLPLLGALFRTSTKTRERHELLVLIRPFVLLAPGEAQSASSEFIRRTSQHPSATEELPDLGVTEPGDILVGDHERSRRQALKALLERARTWETP